MASSTAKRLWIWTEFIFVIFAFQIHLTQHSLGLDSAFSLSASFWRWDFSLLRLFLVTLYKMILLKSWLKSITLCDKISLITWCSPSPISPWRSSNDRLEMKGNYALLTSSINVIQACADNGLCNLKQVCFMQ